MHVLKTIGEAKETVRYIDRPTVKIVIKNDNKILLLNDGLLPGGGVDVNESHYQAVARELTEELGVSVENMREVGAVIQYRDYLEKRYIIQGYVAKLGSVGGTTSTQDETSFTAPNRYYSNTRSVNNVYRGDVEKSTSFSFS